MIKSFVLLCALDLQSDLVDKGIIGGNYVRGPTGTVYIAGYWTNGREIPDSETHINITAEQLPEYAALIPTLNKSVAISGIDDPVGFMAAFGLVRCNADGSDFEDVL